ncbi:Deubiquitinase OTUD6B [Frankliniella fusca]|uniref:Deubiquitinase OTUD6B n=1 Tax=Frankliniella fusca TaxID=407009 RepID=A0AAE1L8P6_9NEOP|nr:Deubiquitinase OTUD6B [Frankliniella fusca]
MADSSESSEILDPFEELEKKFKQERKELQAKIQGLKKTATKGDKKKKKEVQEEIANLEADLERRHKEEEDNLKQNNSAKKIESKEELAKGDENVQENEENVPSAARVSKAEKRRQKKVAASKERDARIQEQEESNLLGPRHKEMLAIVEKLKERGLAIHTIVADGNCLYSAVEHQLKETDSEHSALDYKMIRKLTANYLRKNQDEFLPFMSNPDSGNPMSETEFEAYCQKVEKTTAWGGQIELRAISDSLKCPIEVVQAAGPPMTIGEQYRSSTKPLIVTFHRFLYRLGEHYNSVAPYVEDDPEN